MAYVPALKGYIADVPEFHFTRIDGRKFTFTELSSASVTPNVNFTEVNGGWSLYPTAYLPAASTLEAQLTSSQFDSSLFSLATGEDFAEESYNMPVMEMLPVSSNVVTLGTSETPVSGSVKINGMTLTTSAPTTGTYKVETTGTTTTITFASGDFTNGDMVEVHYELTKSDAISMGVSNDKAALGSADFIWPLQNGGENTTASQFTGASIMGYIIMHIYRVRVTQMPGFDTSYKTAATNGITVATLDPKNAVGSNGNAYKMIYVKKPAEA